MYLELFGLIFCGVHQTAVDKARNESLLFVFLKHLL